MTAYSAFEELQQTTSLGDLVRAAQAGDREAMGELVTRFQRQVQTQAFRRLGNWEEALELSQEVFILAFRRIHQLQVPEAFAGWLRQIVHRSAINHVTRKRFPLAIEQETLDANCTEEQSPLDSMLNNEARAQVHAGLQRLGELDRDTLIAFYLNGQSLIEMSDAFDAPVGTIKRRLHVARKRLAREVETLQI